MATYEDNIDEGRVSFEDGVKSPEEYAPPRKVKVELHFNVYDDQNGSEVLAYAGDLAKAEVRRLLSGAAPVSVAPVGETQPATEAPKRTRRTKEQIAADKAAEEAAKEAGASQTGGGGGEQTSADLDFDPTDGADVASGSTASGDDIDLSEFDVQPEPDAGVEDTITDADLNSAVQKKNAELADPPRIRELIGSYNPDPKSVFQLRQIPADKRAEFLKKLAALKKA